MVSAGLALRAVVDTATYQRDAFNAGQRIAALRKIAQIETLLSEISGCTDCSDERRFADDDVKDAMGICANLRSYFDGSAQ